MQNQLTLNNGQTMPVLGLGTWKSEPGKVGAAVEHALLNGYRHIDCASVYGNEKEIGAVFHDIFTNNKINREDIFITSKLWNTQHHPDNVEKACRKTLQDLQLDYLDLYLIHWGVPFASKDNKELKDEHGFSLTEPVSIQDTWKAMENLVAKGLVKSIGVANFTGAMILDMLSYAKIQPAVNQVEIHPYNTQQELITYCQRKGVVITAYSPLGSFGDVEHRPISDPVIVGLAKKYQKSPAQVLIRWAAQLDLIVIPKTVNKDRVLENKDIFDFELSEKEVQQIKDLNKNHRFVDPSPWWGIPYFK